MKLNTTGPYDTIADPLNQKDLTLNKTNFLVLSYLKDSFLMNAEASALTYAPDGSTNFQYQESIASPLVEALSPEVIKALAKVSITFVKIPGTGFHTIEATFPVVKS